jgi:hypothetical protein
VAFNASGGAGAGRDPRFAGESIGDGRPGPWTQRAREDREAFIEGGAPGP